MEPKNNWKSLLALPLILLTGTTAHALDPSEEDYELKLLGKFVFFDEISRPKGVMSCASCHDPKSGWTGPDSEVNLHQSVMEGAVEGRFGTLKPPTNSYTSFIDPFTVEVVETPRGPREVIHGGHFWNGRAEGRGDQFYPLSATRHIGEEIFFNTKGKYIADEKIAGYSKYFGPLSDQALNPMPNTVEQNIDRRKVCKHVKKSEYAGLYKEIWGERIKCNKRETSHPSDDAAYLDSPETNFDISFKRLMLAVGAYQHSSDVNSFSSRRDIALRLENACADNDESTPCWPIVKNHPNYKNSPGNFPLIMLSEEENYGHDLFYGIESELNPAAKNANCGANCHHSGDDPEGLDPEERYADDRFHNIGTPANPEIPGNPGPDLGLGARTGVAFNMGQHKTPTIRNVDKRPYKDFVKAYTHNGWFKSLESLMHFYNTSDLGAEECPPPGQPGPPCTLYEDTTAAQYGLVRCPAGVETEAQARGLDGDDDIDCWPAPEVDGIIPRGGPDGVGNLGLTKEDELAVVAYMRTLTDLKRVKKPHVWQLRKLGVKK